MTIPVRLWVSVVLLSLMIALAALYLPALNPVGADGASAMDCYLVCYEVCRQFDGGPPECTTVCYVYCFW